MCPRYGRGLLLLLLMTGGEGDPSGHEKLERNGLSAMQKSWNQQAI